MLDADDTPFLSVYPDTPPGMRRCRQFIEDKEARIRPRLPGMVRLESPAPLGAAAAVITESARTELFV